MTGAKKLTLTGYGYKPATLCMVEYKIDLDRMLVSLGEKAFRNRSKSTRAFNGLVKITVREIKGDR